MKNQFSQFILMDNYRGFSNSTIPLAKTNFFVGENSTGKSSVLGLIQILSNYQFWYRTEFKSDETTFSHSSDIISANSENQSTFGVGYLNDNREHSERDYLFYSGFYITFKDKNGSPEPQYLSLSIEDDRLITIKFEPKSASYKISNNFSLAAKTLSEAQLLMRNLKDAHDGPIGFTKFATRVVRNLFDAIILLQTALRKEGVELSNMITPDMRVMPNIRPVWLAPIRSKPKRTYDEPSFDFSPEGDHTPYLINMILSNKKSQGLKTILESVGREAGLFKEVTLKKYGRTKNAPFELDFVLDDVPLSILNVGYGVSQSIPIIAEVVMRSKDTFFIIQQPEVHLHPKAQAAIGTLIFNSALRGTQAIIETHSDYMIDRFRILKKKAHASSKKTVLGSALEIDSQILFFSRKNGFNTVSSIGINEEGDLDEEQPEEYRDFFINEQSDLLGL